MKIVKIICSAMLVLFCTSISFGQDLTEYRWQKRAIKIITKDKESDIYKKQIEILKSNPKGIEERKLIIVTLTEKRFEIGIEADKDSYELTSKKLYLKDKKAATDFEIVLIGLDGGEKLRQTKLLTLEKLFALIDGMPMRRAEMRKND